MMSLDLVRIAKAIAVSSKDPRYKVSAIIIDTAGNIRSTGYNGAPRGVVDYSFRYEKPAKQFYIMHAELNAICHAARSGASTAGCKMFIWGKAPCASCVGAIIQAGIIEVLFKSEDSASSNWQESFEAASIMLNEAGIKVSHYA